MIVKNYPIYVYKRFGFEVNNEIKARLHELNAPLLQVSATQIRQYLREKKSVRYMVPDKVLDEIEKGGYYRK